MKNLIKFFVGVVVLTTMSSCEYYGHDPYFARSYVLKYYILSSKSDALYAHYYSLEDDQIALSLKDKYSVSCFSEGEDKALYDKICEENQDMSYNREVDLWKGKVTIEYSYYPNLTSIVVTSNKDFDASHPAGSSLNEYITVRDLKSTHKYIISNYNKSDRPYRKNHKMSDLTEDDLKVLMDGLGVYTFDAKPEQLGVHTLTFTCTDATGKVHTATIDYEFK